MSRILPPVCLALLAACGGTTVAGDHRPQPAPVAERARAQPEAPAEGEVEDAPTQPTKAEAVVEDPPAPAPVVVAPVSRLPTVGAGDGVALDPSDFPDAQRARYELFQSRCTQCHAMGRTIQALVSGVAPISGAPFTPEFIKAYVVQLMRTPNSGISKEDAPELILFLQFVRTLAGAP